MFWLRPRPGMPPVSVIMSDAVVLHTEGDPALADRRNELPTGA